MNTIKGLLTLQILSENDSRVAASLKGAESRVHSILMLYDKLYSTDNYREMPVREYLESLIDDIAGSFPEYRGVSVETDFQDFILNVKFLSPLGIMINELITNSIKYAFKSKDSGLIKISGQQAGDRVKVIVKDNGSGIPESVDFGNSTGFGLDLVKMLAEQLNGTVEIIRDKGTEIVIQFNVE
jgi:two-component sensor histidine kinase